MDVSAGRAPRVLLTRRLPDDVEAAFAHDVDCVRNATDAPMDAAALRDALRDFDVVVPTVTDRLDAAVLAGGPHRCRLLANVGAGTDHIDLEAAHRAGIAVTNTPGVLTDDTADLALALILMACRRLGEGERLVRAGAWAGWAPTHHLGRTLTGATLGIVGLGRIGQALARRALACGMRVQACGAAPDRVRAAIAADATLGAVQVAPTRDALLATSDVVSLHAPSTPATRGMIDAAALARMPRGSVLVNTARGALVDEDALADALARGHLAAAGLDVHAAEPRVHDRLRAMECVVLLPHLGSATRETRRAMGMAAHANVLAWRDGRALPSRVR
jgi:lactate dehydrogenase-like 2-hydroxyacid dehydrogenase